MNLGILLPLGGSLTDMRFHGQEERFLKYYLGKYCRKFTEVKLFSYSDEKSKNLPDNCEFLVNNKNLHRYLFAIAIPFLFRKQIRECDVFRCFHLNGIVPALLIKLLYQKKIVFNFNYDYKKWAVIENKSYLLPFFWILEPLAFKFADHIFVADELMMQYATKFTARNKITIIRNGVDTKVFCPAKYIKKPKLIIFSVGRLETQKNYEMLVKAVAGLRQKVTLLIVGRGSLKEKLKERAKQLGVDLKIVDVIAHLSLPVYYQQADIYVQPSLAEAPVKTLIEAMSCAVACVGTQVVGTSDLIKDGQNGLLAKLDSDSLREKMQQLLDDRLLAKKLGQKARETILMKYDLEEMVEKEIKALKNI